MYIYYFILQEPRKHGTHDQWLRDAMPGFCRQALKLSPCISIQVVSLKSAELVNELQGVLISALAVHLELHAVFHSDRKLNE